MLSPGEEAWWGGLASSYYYALLAPLTVPMAVVASYAGWLSFELFRNN
jgi:hypothetical protein